MLELGIGDSLMFQAIYRRRFSSGVRVDKSRHVCDAAVSVSGGWQVICALAESYVLTCPLPQFVDIDLWGSATKVLHAIFKRRPASIVVVYHHYLKQGVSDKHFSLYRVREMGDFLVKLAQDCDMVICASVNLEERGHQNGYVVLERKT